MFASLEFNGRRPRLFPLALLLALATPTLGKSVHAADEAQPNRWEAAILAFEQSDMDQPPAKRGIVFVGSSSIKGWDLKRSFPDLPVINRGFGGSQLADSVHFADRVVVKHEPRVVVLYAGDNDLAAGKSPEQVFADYQAFVKRVHTALPKTRIVFIAVKPSLKRWALVDKVRETNRLVQQATQSSDQLVFVDVDKPMIGDDGVPRAELFKPDGLHLTDAGYDLWASLLRPELIE